MRGSQVSLAATGFLLAIGGTARLQLAKQISWVNGLVVARQLFQELPTPGHTEFREGLR